MTAGTIQPDTVRHPAPDVIRTFQVHIPTKDQMLDDITLYWLTNSATSSAQLYRENNNNNNFNAVEQKTADIKLPSSGRPSGRCTERREAAPAPPTSRPRQGVSAPGSG